MHYKFYIDSINGCSTSRKICSHFIVDLLVSKDKLGFIIFFSGCFVVKRDIWMTIGFHLSSGILIDFFLSILFLCSKVHYIYCEKRELKEFSTFEMYWFIWVFKFVESSSFYWNHQPAYRSRRFRRITFALNFAFTSWSSLILMSRTKSMLPFSNSRSSLWLPLSLLLFLLPPLYSRFPSSFLTRIAPVFLCCSSSPAFIICNRKISNENN